MKKIILLLSILVSHVAISQPCPPTPVQQLRGDSLVARKIKLCGATPGLYKFNSNFHFVPAVAGTDYSTPSSLSDSLDNYVKKSGDTMSGDLDMDQNNIEDCGTVTVNKLEVVGTVDGGTPDAAIRLNRILDGNGASGHGFRDQTDFRDGTYAYCAYDDASILNSGTTENFDHHISFQGRGGHNTEGTTSNTIGFGHYYSVNDGTVSNMIGFESLPAIEGAFGATVTNRFGTWIKDVAGSGPLSNNYGIFVSNLTRASGDNYAIYTDGTTPSRFGGNVTIAGHETVDTLYGSSTSSGNLRLESTSNATKGKILLGAASGYDGTSGFLGIGTQSPAAQLHLSGNISASAWTTNGIGFRTSDQTFNDNTSSGAVTNMYFHRLGVPTVTSTSVTTYTNGIGFYFPAPAASGNATITNGYSIATQGNIQIQGSTIQMSNGGTNSTLQIPNSTSMFRIQTGGSNATRFTIATTTGLVGIGPTAPTPTAHLHVAANTTSNSTLRLEESATDPSAPNAGDLWNNAGLLKQRTGGVTYILAKTLTNTATLNFDLTSVNYEDLTITVTGAADGDAVSIAIPAASATANVVFTSWVSATNTVTIRASRIDVASGADPASGTFRASVIKY